jgi:short-subunit dehydrogenase involved in D-alanine esterification of teichoic acids
MKLTGNTIFITGGGSGKRIGDGMPVTRPEPQNSVHGR